MKKKMIVLMLAGMLAVLPGCQSLRGTGGTDSGEGAETEEGTSSTDSENTSSLPWTDEEMFTNRDQETEYTESSSVKIQLNGTTAEATSDSVEISGSTVTITEEACYIISGTLEDGMIIVNAPDTAKLQLVFDGVDITSQTSAALYILEADKVFLTLAEGSENALSNGGEFTAIDDNNIDSVIFSKQDLTMNGSGSLTLTSPAGHGIVSKDDLVITGGTYTVESASHGIQANDSVRVTGDTYLTLDAGKDGIHAENEEDAELGFVYISGGFFDIAAEGDGISAGSCLQISEGEITILAGGGSENGDQESSEAWGGFGGGGVPGGGGTMGGGAPGDRGAGRENGGIDTTEEDSSTSMKGIKAGTEMLISGGTITVDAADDAIHSNGTITVEAGSFELATGDDAFHADDTLTVAGGTIRITESYEGLEALHVNVQGGDITLTATDDGLNAAGGTDSSGTEGGRDGMFGGPGGGGMSSSDGTITISGGTLYINASGDGIDANGSLEISGGYTVVTGPTQGDTATLDYDTEAVITGGTFIGTGASGMAQTFSSSSQGVVAVSVGSQEAGTEIVLSDESGNEILSAAPELSYAVVILSSPELVSGETYILTAGDVSGEVEAN